MINYKKEFRAFLKKEGAYREYLKEQKSHDSSVWGAPLNEITEPEGYIDMAFTWNTTHKEHTYWDNLDAKWLKLLSKLQDPKYYLDIVPDFEMETHADGTIKVGCQTIDPKKSLKLFKILAKLHGYEVEG